MRCQSSDVNNWFFLTNWPRIHVSFFFSLHYPSSLLVGAHRTSLTNDLYPVYLTVNKTSQMLAHLLSD